MKYASLLKNDMVNGEGVCVSLFVQGCPHKCPGCFNPESWDFNGGEEVPADLKGQIIKAISANGLMRNFSVLGGEPLCDENLQFVHDIINVVRSAYPQIHIFLWSGYTLEELQERKDNKTLREILQKIDTLIDGRFIEEERDITLKMRGSKNQRIINMREIDFS